MSIRPRITFIVFGLLGGVLLLNLVLPIANLLVQADWKVWLASLEQPDARAALQTSALASSIAVLVMVSLGVPLGYLLARGRVPFKRFWIGLVFLPMVVPDLAGG